MHSDERRRARSVDGQRRTVQAEQVRYPPCRDAARGPTDIVHLGADAGATQHVEVLGLGDADERSRPGAVERPGRDRRPLDGLPADLEQQSLLRIEPQRLVVVHPEDPGVEPGDVPEEAAALPRRIRSHRPTPGRHDRDGVAAPDQ